MIILSINIYTDWRKDFARFDAELQQRNIKITDCIDSSTEILIYVQTMTKDENELVTELARRHFGKAYGGLLLI